MNYLNLFQLRSHLNPDRVARFNQFIFPLYASFLSGGVEVVQTMNEARNENETTQAFVIDISLKKYRTIQAILEHLSGQIKVVVRDFEQSNIHIFAWIQLDSFV
jgi:hypothetical protein